MNFGLRISDCGVEPSESNPVMIDFGLQFKSAFRNSKSEIWHGASYRIRTGVSALATPCLEPTGPTMRVTEPRAEATGGCAQPPFV